MRGLDNRPLPAIFGVVIFLMGFAVLWWNEGAAVQDRASLLQMERDSIPANAALDPANEGQLLVLSGVPVSLDAPLQDPELGLSLDALHMRRTVEMYQVVPRKEEDGAVSTRLEWSDTPQTARDAGLGIDNPPMPFQSGTRSTDGARVGAFRLSSPLVDRMRWYTPVSPELIQPDLPQDSWVDGEWLYVRSAVESTAPLAQQVGDLRIKVEAVLPQTVSLVAQQEGDLLSVPTRNGESGFALVRQGTLGKAALLAEGRGEVSARTTAMRVIGIVMLVLGLRVVLRGVSGVLTRIPLLGGALSAGIWLVAGLTGAALGLLTIAVAWFAWRPMLSLSLLAIAAAALAVELFVLRKRRRSADEAETLASGAT